MKQRLKRWRRPVVGTPLAARTVRVAAALAIALAGLTVVAAVRPAQAGANLRVVVHVDGPKGGQVEVSGVWYQWLPDYGINNSPYWDVVNGDFLVPNACGLRVYQAFQYTWYSNGVVVSTKPIGYPDDLQGVVFTGPITTLTIDATGTDVVTPAGDLCAEQTAPWYVPGPIENEDTAPPTGVDMLVLEFDPPDNLIVPAFEFLDWTGKPVDVDPPSHRDPPRPDPCSIPEFCEDPDDPDDPGGGPGPTLDPCVLHPTRPECLPTDPPRRH